MCPLFFYLYCSAPPDHHHLIIATTNTQGECKNISITNCIFRGSTNEARSVIGIQSLTGKPSSNITITDCSIDRPHLCIQTTGPCKDLCITNTTIKTGYILLDKGTEFSFRGCIFLNMNYGIQLKDRCSGSFESCSMDHAAINVYSTAPEDSEKIVNTITISECSFKTLASVSILTVYQV